ncbi:MAG TPA: hypothetical protein VGE24_13670, partial [Emticicia sp.]
IFHKGTEPDFLSDKKNTALETNNNDSTIGIRLFPDIENTVLRNKAIQFIFEKLVSYNCISKNSQQALSDFFTGNVIIERKINWQQPKNTLVYFFNLLDGNFKTKIKMINTKNKWEIVTTSFTLNGNEISSDNFHRVDTPAYSSRCRHLLEELYDELTKKFPRT